MSLGWFWIWSFVAYLCRSSYHLYDVLHFRSHTVLQPTLSATWEGALLALLSIQTHNALYGNNSVEPSRDFFFFLNKWQKDLGHCSGAVPPNASTQEQHPGEMIVYVHCLMYVLSCSHDVQLLSCFVSQKWDLGMKSCSFGYSRIPLR